LFEFLLRSFYNPFRKHREREREKENIKFENIKCVVWLFCLNNSFSSLFEIVFSFSIIELVKKKQQQQQQHPVISKFK